MLKRIASLALIFLCLPIVATGAMIHVPGDQPTIQAGIDAAVNGDTVIVADGIWTGDGNRDLDFAGKAITLISEKGPGACVIDCQGSDADRHRGLRFHSGEGRDSVVEGFRITSGYRIDGGAILCEGASPTIRGNLIEANTALENGGGICCRGGAVPLIESNTIDGNWAWLGGGLYSVDASPTISGNLLIDNSSDNGGGICCNGSGSPRISGNQILYNHCTNGGGIWCHGPAALIENNLIYYNIVDYDGGAIHCSAPVEITFCTITGNIADSNGGGVSGSGTVVHTIFSNNLWKDIHGEFNVTWSCVHNVPGEGNFSADPLFVTGPGGDFYLSQTAAGQAADSPCVDAGDPAGGMIEGTTRTDLVQDAGIVDTGFHYPLETGPRLVIGPGPGYDNPPVVGVFPPYQDAEVEHEFSAYGAPHYGAKVTVGQVTDNFGDEILTGAGPGAIYGPHVRGFQVDGTPLPHLNFLAYGTNKYGVNVAAGDIDADGIDEILTGAGPGAVFGPHVRAFDYDGSSGVTPVPGVSYFAYGTPRWGVNVTAGDIDGDGYDEIVTGAGPGPVYGPHVRGWNVDGGTAAAIPAVSFLAYGTNKFGVNVTCGDVDGDGIDEIVTGAGPGQVFGAHVRGWNFDGAALAPITGISFFAWVPNESRFGATVFAGADLDDDDRDEIVVGPGPDPSMATPVKVYRYDGMQVIQWISLEAFPGLTHGANVAAGLF